MGLYLEYKERLKLLAIIAGGVGRSHHGSPALMANESFEILDAIEKEYQVRIKDGRIA